MCFYDRKDLFEPSYINKRILLNLKNGLIHSVNYCIDNITYKEIVDAKKEVIIEKQDVINLL